MHLIKRHFIILFLFCVSSAAFSLEGFDHPWSIGVSGGYGSTTWQGLVPKFNNQNESLTLFTPVKTTEGGGVWGVFAGYDLTSYFGLEANYIHYPSASILFDENSLFAFNHDGQKLMNTHTEAAFLLAKVMMLFPRTHLRAYSGAGVADVHRSDTLNNQWVASPVFAIGMNNLFTPHIIASIEAHYIAGRGEVELEPSVDYIPFLYAVYLKIGYQFNL
jgi:hypothetical protein